MHPELLDPSALSPFKCQHVIAGDFSDLPFEIAAMVFDNINDFRDLVACSLTCRNWHAVVWPTRFELHVPGHVTNLRVFEAFLARCQSLRRLDASRAVLPGSFVPTLASLTRLEALDAACSPSGRRKCSPEERTIEPQQLAPVTCNLQGLRSLGLAERHFHPQLSALTALKSLDLSYTVLHTESLDELSNLTGLERLSLCGAKCLLVERGSHMNTMGLLSLTNLKALDIADTRFSAVIFEQLCERLVMLESLDVSGCTSLESRTVQAVSKLTTLTDLSLGLLKLKGQCLQAVASCLTRLRKLDLSQLHGLPDQFSELAGLTGLEVLCLSKSRVSNHAMRVRSNFVKHVLFVLPCSSDGQQAHVPVVGIGGGGGTCAIVGIHFWFVVF
eukprot:TRINITY_DN3138_c0_g1_i2.p1 TRINITY_DN3138_c0_g1~~TRINITY_DN3138_c0_g1_i2.p1  ORF type:complete len:423 (+),score=43.51 TRINITY_DN3138_c0_g1_i2:110-1270(+)